MSVYKSASPGKRRGHHPARYRKQRSGSSEFSLAPADDAETKERKRRRRIEPPFPSLSPSPSPPPPRPPHPIARQRSPRGAELPRRAVRPAVSPIDRSIDRPQGNLWQDPLRFTRALAIHRRLGDRLAIFVVVDRMCVLPQILWHFEYLSSIRKC
jgi:hypothetical protein